MKKIIFLIIFTFLTPLSLSAELKVGFIGGFSGPGKAFGDAARNGFEFGKEEHGGERIKIFYEDDQFNPVKTVASFNKLVEYNKVDLVIVLGSTPASAIAPLAEKKKIPLIAWASAEHIAKNRKWVIRSWASGAEEGAKLASKAKELKINKVATLVYSDDYALSVIEGFKNKFSNTFSLGEIGRVEIDLSSMALRAKAKQVDAIVFCLSVGQSAELARQLRRIKFNPVLLGCETLNNEEEVKLAKGALKGAFFATIPVKKEFIKKYKKKFKASTSIGGSAVHYELYKILAKMAKENNLNSETILSKLLNSEIKSSSIGAFKITNENNDQSFKLPIIIRSVS